MNAVLSAALAAGLTLTLATTERADGSGARHAALDGRALWSDAVGAAITPSARADGSRNSSGTIATESGLRLPPLRLATVPATQPMPAWMPFTNNSSVDEWGSGWLVRLSPQRRGQCDTVHLSDMMRLVCISW